MDCKIILSIGSINIYWFGTIIALGMLAGLGTAMLLAKRAGKNILPVIDMMLQGMVSAVVLSRFFYIVMHLSLYKDNPLEMIFIWRGGLSLFGGIVGFLVAVFLYSQKNKSDFWHWSDILAPAMAFGLSIGQWANLASQEYFGKPVTEAYGIYVDYAVRPPGYEEYDYFFPVFMYHSAWLMAVFALLTVLFLCREKFRLKKGTVFVSFIILYACGRIIFDSLCIEPEKIGFVNLSYVTTTLLVAVILYLWFRRAA